MSEYVLYVNDAETTGLHAEKNDIIEISLWRSSDNVQKTWCLKPLNPENIDDKALKVNKHKREDILWMTAFGRETYRIPSEVVAEIEAWILSDGAAIDDRVFIGQNPTFDFDFMKALWSKVGCSDTFPFGEFIMDTLLIARLIDICTGKKRKRYNLGSLAKDFKVAKGTAHSASGDVKTTIGLFLKIFELVRPVLKETCSEFYTETEDLSDEI